MADDLGLHHDLSGDFLEDLDQDLSWAVDLDLDRDLSGNNQKISIFFFVTEDFVRMTSKVDD